ncbi:hypothetical protein [Nocardia nova]|uniref:hypothetical protein n=1 Tax=Nocardia nova TaxID=37330 RepID=UPI0033D2E916
MVSFSDTEYRRTTLPNPVATRVLLTLTVAFSVVVVAFGVIALLAQSAMLPPGCAVTDGVRFFGALIAVRNIPLGLAAIYVIVRRERVDPVAVLGLSAVVQFGDAVLGLVHGVLGMTISDLAGAILYALTAVVISNGRRGRAL